MININAIFPIAGKGERFGGTFKPKLIFNGRTFLENAVDTIKSDKRINPKFYFICNNKQEREENVVEWIKSIYPEAKVIVIPDQTSGPLATLSEAELLIDKYFSKQSIPCVICDCDHWLSIKDLDLDFLNVGVETVVLPLWPISNDEISSWLVCRANKDEVSFLEKPQTVSQENEFGVIGCYFFSNTGEFFKKITDVKGTSVSDYLITFIDELKFHFFTPEEAKFFGDPKRLAKQEAKDKK
jgi:hypothetical protein